jgi:hypothetical protein
MTDDESRRRGPRVRLKAHPRIMYVHSFIAKPGLEALPLILLPNFLSFYPRRDDVSLSIKHNKVCICTTT